MKISVLIICTAILIVCPCSHYVCDITNPAGTDPTQLVCMTKSYDANGVSTLHFSKDGCPNGKVCDYSFTDSTDKCIPFHPRSLVAGENCTESNACYSGKCTNGKCEGGAEGIDCVFDIECGTGLACMQSTCKKVAKENDACGEAVKCGSNLICNMEKCVVPGSIKIGGAADAPLACETMFYETIGTNKLCSNAPHLENYNSKGPTICGADQNCKYTYKSNGNQTASIIGSCDCGRGSADLTYCQPGLGDLSKDVALFINYLKIKKPDCHVAKPYFCKNLYWDNDTKMAYSAYMNITQQYMFDELEACVKVMNHMYFDGVQTFIWNESRPNNNGSNGSNDSAMLTVLPVSRSFWATVLLIATIIIIF